MSKFCIFCGKKPEIKSKEHVIPHWLIALTGKPNRKVNLGAMKTMDENCMKQRKYSFDSFTFPACDTCNNHYSELENKSKVILEKILHERLVTPAEINCLLDWFDKVRVGLWLGFNQLDKKAVKINPSFHISTRIGQYDRALYISKSDSCDQKLNFGGADTFSFAYQPCAFTLTINNYYFTNVSTLFLFSRRLGFPYPKKIEAYASGEGKGKNLTQLSLSKGRDRIMNPPIRFSHSLKGIEIYQPMFPGGLIKDGELKEYNCRYVKDNSLDSQNGIGGIFKKEKNRIKKISNTDKISLSPNLIYPDFDLFHKSAINILKWQNYFNLNLSDMSLLSKEDRKYRLKSYKGAIKINNLMLSSYEEQYKKIKKQRALV